jgi:hypothetical protein
MERRREKGLDRAVRPPLFENRAEPLARVRGILIEKAIADLQSVVGRGRVPRTDR